MEMNCVGGWGMIRVVELVAPLCLRSKAHQFGIGFNSADRYESIQSVASPPSQHRAAHAG